MNHTVPFRTWLSLIGLTFSAFVFNTSEFMPIGLLTDIAVDLKVTEARAGLLISVYAWVVTLTSLPLMLLVSRMEYKKLLLGVFVVFIASHVLSAASASYAVLLVSRIGVACAHAVFWSIAPPLAVRIVPEGKRAMALSMIVTGTSIAMIVGLPLGRVIGLHVGWRMTFFWVAVAASVVFLFLAFVFPKVPSRNAVSLRKLPSLLKNPVLIGIYLLTFLVVTAHYTGYSYIEPFLGQVAGLKESWITGVLIVFGVSGIFGSVLFSKYYDRFPSVLIGFVTIGIALFLILLHLSSFSAYTVIVLCVCWGLAITVFNLIFQAEVIRFAPQATTIAMSVFSGIYNLGIGSGALVGGAVCAYFSISDIGYVGGILALIASVYCMKRLLRLLRVKQKDF